MAKRRTLSAPSPEELAAMEAEMGAKPSRRPVAPIAQVAAEAAQAGEGVSAEIRAERARNAADAARLLEAEKSGRLLTEVALSEIEADAIIRDRIDLDEDEMMELQLSISKNGLRLPLEVFELAEPYDGVRYGLLSGYRRLKACAALAAVGRQEFARVNVIVRAPEGVDEAYISMVEENEVRASLTPFERGRVAVIAVGQGAFASVHDAVDRLYGTASKAKRSKIRSFALVFEELGDMLTFPEALSEARGLALASALQQGGQSVLREALDGPPPADKDEEWAVLEEALASLTAAPPSRRKGGRPKRVVSSDILVTTSGYRVKAERKGSGIIVQVDGPHLNDDLVRSLAQHVQYLLEKS